MGVVSYTARLLSPKKIIPYSRRSEFCAENPGNNGTKLQNLKALEGCKRAFRIICDVANAGIRLTFRADASACLNQLTGDAKSRTQPHGQQNPNITSPVQFRSGRQTNANNAAYFDS
jgi:hypothetical protein